MLCHQRLLTLRDRTTHTLRPLSRGEMLTLLPIDDLWRLLHDLLALGQDHLDVAWIRPDPTLVLA